jgi:hypothetical protein
MTACQLCGMKHNPAAHDAEPTCDHEWTERGGPGDEWRECWLCGLQEDR